MTDQQHTTFKMQKGAWLKTLQILAEKMMRDSWATGDDTAWKPSMAALLAHAAVPPQQSAQPVAEVVTSVPHLRTIFVRMVPGAVIPEIGAQLYAAAQPVEVQRPITDGAKEFLAYLDDCETCCIASDVAGAFHAGWKAAHNIKPTSTEGEHCDN